MNNQEYKFNFDFKTFYQSVYNAPAGLQLHLAKKLLENTSDKLVRNQRVYRHKVESLANAIDEIIAERKDNYLRSRYGVDDHE